MVYLVDGLERSCEIQRCLESYTGHLLASRWWQAIFTRGKILFDFSPQVPVLADRACFRLAPQGGNHMAIPLQELKTFQAVNLEHKSDQTNVRSPIPSKVVEWALVEIVVLLTGIQNSLEKHEE